MRNKIYLFAAEVLAPLQALYPKRQSWDEWLIRAFDAYCGYTDGVGVLILAPQPPKPDRAEKEPRGAVTVLRPLTEADAFSFVCASVHQDLKDGVRTEVVSSHPRILRAFAASHCRIVPPERFAERLDRTLKVNKEKITKEPRQKFEGLSPAEVEYWLRMFTQEGGDR